MDFSSLNVLHLEDSEDDAFFVRRCMLQAYPNCTIKVVDNGEDYARLLKEFKPDIVLSDHSMPGYDSIRALTLLQNENIRIPFILVTGAVSEEFAVHCLKLGADDYILKSGLSRLPNAVRRSLDERRIEAQRDELIQRLQTSLKEKDELLKEKSVLLAEIHHRVKNNLAIITSLLNAQARSVDDEKVKNLLKEGQSRVISMGMVHEMLYQEDNYSKVGFKEYALKLLQHISMNYHRPDLKVDYQVEAKDIYLNINVAVPCALILNELVTNAYKYAFKGKGHGEIKVLMTKNEEEFTLTVQDNGIGLPAVVNESTLGLSLIRGLAKQIDGKLIINREGGTGFSVIFKQKQNELVVH